MKAWLLLLALLCGCSGAPDIEVPKCAGLAEAAGRGPEGMIWIPPGPTVLGSDRFHPEEGPKRIAQVAGFWIDAHEVTNAQFAQFVQATNYRTTVERMGGGAVFHSPLGAAVPADISQWWRIEASANWRTPRGAAGRLATANEPVLQVTQEDALAYARWQGRHLPTEAEWERAARGGIADADYSWGDEPPAKHATHKANHWQGVFPLADRGDDGFKGVAPVGCFEPNGYGLYDMAGNAWELTAEAWNKGEGAQKAAVIKGGSWLCADHFCLRYRPAARQPSDPSLGTDHIGFRTALRPARRAPPASR
jgi:formylglycine-generating enzyme required for sulfatase activity